MIGSRVRFGLGALLAVSAACAPAAEKAADSTVAAPDSSGVTPTPSTPAVTPAPDSTTKPAIPPTPGTSAQAQTQPQTQTPTPAPTPTPTATPSETVLTGRIVVGGMASDQNTTLQVEGSSPTTLVGPLESELRRLNAATVWVAGSPGRGRIATFTVSRYEIVSIDGTKPVVGVLASRDGATWLAAERDTVKLLSTTPEIRAKIGAKVWVIGRRSGAEMTPQSFGVIREP